jgi:hypothetical protein
VKLPARRSSQTTCRLARDTHFNPALPTWAMSNA